jgi:hypothetical protein
MPRTKSDTPKEVKPRTRKPKAEKIVPVVPVTIPPEVDLSANVISVKIGGPGLDAKPIDLAPGSTVGALLEASGYSAAGRTIRVGNRIAGLKTVLKNGDIVTLATKSGGGR